MCDLLEEMVELAVAVRGTDDGDLGRCAFVVLKTESVQDGFCTMAVGMLFPDTALGAVNGSAPELVRVRQRANDKFSLLLCAGNSEALLIRWK